MTKLTLPSLPYESWTDTRITIHLILQIIGKARLGLTARKNHWWFITLYVSPRGFSTFTIPVDDGSNGLEIELDVINKAVVITHSEKGVVEIELHTKPSVAQFYTRFKEALSKMGLSPRFIEKPFDMGIEKPFDQLDKWNVLQKALGKGPATEMPVRNILRQKKCPVHIYWHHMDLAVTRFSGKKLEPMDKSARLSDRDAYSHEQISFGFWVGDDNVPEPAYYSYTYPSPDKIDQQQLKPSEASWVDSNGSPMAFLRYEDVRAADDPRQAVLDFLESAYQAGANLAGWPVGELTAPPLEEV